ncbi:hypothetical protein SeMB42_g02624 [Synchytrium endobioticum]|uniref:Uncharacterized protein n=1 Tax=Synchytrium endobioticum TaxID=286115 RepID=A0A507DCU2_9FUNG|nr:hypothetical protein SeMB42_g02624 [Synchytrium endobioticum]
MGYELVLTHSPYSRNLGFFSPHYLAHVLLKMAPGQKDARVNTPLSNPKACRKTSPHTNSLLVNPVVR